MSPSDIIRGVIFEPVYAGRCVADEVAHKYSASCMWRRVDSVLMPQSTPPYLEGLTSFRSALFGHSSPLLGAVLDQLSRDKHVYAFQLACA
jgi:hypothetical protein